MNKMADDIRERLRPKKRISYKAMAGSAQKVPCQRANKTAAGRCCCNCAYHYSDHSHPVTDGIACSHIRGWICGAPEVGFSSGWGRHGLCECHATTDELRKLHETAAIQQVIQLLPPRLREVVETDMWFMHEQKRRKGVGGR